MTGGALAVGEGGEVRRGLKGKDGRSLMSDITITWRNTIHASIPYLDIIFPLMSDITITWRNTMRCMRCGEALVHEDEQIDCMCRRCGEKLLKRRGRQYQEKGGVFFPPDIPPTRRPAYAGPPRGRKGSCGPRSRKPGRPRENRSR